MENSRNKGEIKMYLEISDNTYRTYQIIWDNMKEVLKEKFIALSSSLKELKAGLGI